MDKLISTLENDAYTMMVHKRSLNYVNSWCVEEKRFFFPLWKIVEIHIFLKSCQAVEASQHAFAVMLICRARWQSPSTGKESEHGGHSERLEGRSSGLLACQRAAVLGGGHNREGVRSGEKRRHHLF